MHCPICPVEVKSGVRSLNIHVKSTHLGVKKKCPKCDRILLLGKFNRHIRGSCLGGKDAEIIKCELCDAAFAWQTQ